jgi:hypothetical protein
VIISLILTIASSVNAIRSVCRRAWFSTPSRAAGSRIAP